MTSNQPCQKCGGTGFNPEVQSGHVNDNTCPNCHGSGVEPEPATTSSELVSNSLHLLMQHTVALFDLIGDEFAPKKQEGGSPERKRLLALVGAANQLDNELAKKLDALINREKHAYAAEVRKAQTDRFYDLLYGVIHQSMRLQVSEARQFIEAEYAAIAHERQQAGRGKRNGE